MADKNAIQKHEKAINTLESNLETMKERVQGSQELTMARLSTLEERLNAMNVSHEEIKKGVAELLQRDKQRENLGKGLEAGEGSSNQPPLKTPIIPGKHTTTPTHTQFGTINDSIVVDEQGLISNTMPIPVVSHDFVPDLSMRSKNITYSSDISQPTTFMMSHIPPQSPVFAHSLPQIIPTMTHVPPGFYNNSVQAPRYNPPPFNTQPIYTHAS